MTDNNGIVIKEIYQMTYHADSTDFDFSLDKPIYIVIGFGNFEEDLAIPVSREYVENKKFKEFIKDFIIDKNEEDILNTLNIPTIDIDTTLRKKLLNTFSRIKDIILRSDEDKGEDKDEDKEDKEDKDKYKDKDRYDIYTIPLDLGIGWQIKGQTIDEKLVDQELPLINNLMYIVINAPGENYVNIRQYMAIFKFKILESTRVESRVSRVIRTDRSEIRFGPIETPIAYNPNIYELMKLDVVSRRIKERKKWIPISDKELFYLIFAPIRFLRFKHMQQRLISPYIEGGKNKPSIIEDIRDNSLLLGGIWEYKDLEFLAQIDMLIKNGIIVPTDFNFYGPPYTIIYKAIKDGILYVGGIEHNFDAPKEEIEIKNGIEEKIRKPGHFITYMCMKRMGSEGTQVLIKYQNEIGTTNKMLTCKELDMEMAGMMDSSTKSSDIIPIGSSENKMNKM